MYTHSHSNSHTRTHTPTHIHALTYSPVYTHTFCADVDDVEGQGGGGAESHDGASEPSTAEGGGAHSHGKCKEEDSCPVWRQNKHSPSATEENSHGKWKEKDCYFLCRILICKLLHHKRKGGGKTRVGQNPKCAQYMALMFVRCCALLKCYLMLAI